jgi:hypothetical protein
LVKPFVEIATHADIERPISFCDLILDVQSKFLDIGVAFEEEKSSLLASDVDDLVGEGHFVVGRAVVETWLYARALSIIASQMPFDLRMSSTVSRIAPRPALALVT